MPQTGWFETEHNSLIVLEAGSPESRRRQGGILADNLFHAFLSSWGLPPILAHPGFAAATTPLSASVSPRLSSSVSVSVSLTKAGHVRDALTTYFFKHSTSK